MIPPQAMHYVGLAIARAFGWGTGQLASRGIGALDGDILRLGRLDEPALLAEIGRRGDGPAGGAHRAGDLAGQGRAIVEGLLPRARALICPHQDTIAAMVGGPEADIVRVVVGYLQFGLPFALLAPVATLLVKRGLPLLCGPG
jgi:hypothetical protein